MSHYRPTQQERWIMETVAMGRVTVPVTIGNVSELYLAEKGLLPADQVHRLQVPDALVDTGSTYLSMPLRLIRQLGFDKPYAVRAAQTTVGPIERGVYGPVRLTIENRIFHGDVTEVDDSCPVLIGQLALEGLDFIVDARNQKLIGNPAHGGEQMIELY
jgi:predicted aspartyl protease